MHIIYERSGGFLGQTTKSSFDLSDLPEEDANKLQSIIKEIDFSALQENRLGSQSAPDQFTYTITVHSQDSQHTVVTNDSSAPEELKPLIDFLNQLARSQRSKS